MDIIPVNDCPPIRGYDSAEAAIAAAKSHPLQGRTRADGAKLQGKTFVGARVARDRWSLEFSGSMWLDVLACDGEIEWHLNETGPTFETDDSPYTLRWPSGGEEIIDPRQLIEGRIGSAFWQLWADDLGFYVYLRRQLILWFRGKSRTEDGTDILYVADEE